MIVKRTSGYFKGMCEHCCTAMDSLHYLIRDISMGPARESCGGVKLANRSLHLLFSNRICCTSASDLAGHLSCRPAGVRVRERLPRFYPERRYLMKTMYFVSSGFGMLIREKELTGSNCNFARVVVVCTIDPRQ